MALLQQKHILLVEDDEDAVSATAAILERSGYSVRLETKSLKALGAFSEKPDIFDLAFLTHGMPDLTGLELAQRMRRIRPGLPIVLYTGDLGGPSSEQVEATCKGGRVVTKPATRKELTDTIQAAFGGGWAETGRDRRSTGLEAMPSTYLNCFSRAS